jgi:hypothetical protein
MNERWLVPIMVAVVGLAGGLGGSYLGGRSANITQQKQFENQRLADVEDLAVAAYSNFVRTAARIAFLGRKANDAERAQVFAAEAQVGFLFQEEEEVKEAGTRTCGTCTIEPRRGGFQSQTGGIQCGGSTQL